MHQSKKFSFVIVNDEAHSTQILTQYINALPQLELIKTYDNSIAAIKEIASAKSSIDFLLLEINMPEISGLEVAAIIRHKVDKLIFVSTHSKHSLAAYDVQCNQYLIKPVSQQKFAETINQLIVPPNHDLHLSNRNVFIKSGIKGNYLMVNYDDIIYINALEHYVVIHTLTTQYIQHMSMKEVEYALRGNHNFIRVHKSYIISKDHILSVYGNTIVLINNLEIAIGTTYKQSFSKFLNSNLLS